MANIKSAKKRIKVIEKKTLRNRVVKSKTKSAVKKFVVACKAHNHEEAIKVYPLTASAIDRAASKGVIHKNTAARRKSRLAKMMNKLAQ